MAMVLSLKPMGPAQVDVLTAKKTAANASVSANLVRILNENSANKSSMMNQWFISNFWFKNLQQPQWFTSANK
jgi:hypothetical protein